MNWREYGKILIIGNGGSYANSIHAANDFLLCGLPAFTLDPATLTASANDFGYETVFARWVAAVGRKGDILVALSGSGKSPNIIDALKTAKVIGMTTLGVFGAYNKGWDSIDGKPVLDHCVLRGDNMQAAEEAQLAWAHEIMLSLRK